LLIFSARALVIVSTFEVGGHTDIQKFYFHYDLCPEAALEHCDGIRGRVFIEPRPLNGKRGNMRSCSIRSAAQRVVSRVLTKRRIRYTLPTKVLSLRVRAINLIRPVVCPDLRIERMLVSDLNNVGPVPGSEWVSVSTT